MQGSALVGMALVLYESPDVLLQFLPVLLHGASAVPQTLQVLLVLLPPPAQDVPLGTQPRLLFGTLFHAALQLLFALVNVQQVALMLASPRLLLLLLLHVDLLQMEEVLTLLLQVALSLLILDGAETLTG